MNLTMSSRTEGNAAILTAAGEVDIETAPILRDAIVGLIDEGARQIVIDMEAVEFCDSTGICVLVACHQRVEPLDDASITLMNVRPNVRKAFDITKLADMFGLPPAAA
jgi:anti-sigma B factor antagonist